jgi:hypothetical protein
MHGLVTSGHRLRQRQSARRRCRHGQRCRCGPSLHRSPALPQLCSAHPRSGGRQRGLVLRTFRPPSSCSRRTMLTAEVLAGRVSLLQAAAQVRRVVDLVTAYKLAKDPACKGGAPLMRRAS